VVNDILATRFVANLIRFIDAAVPRRAGFALFIDSARERARNENKYVDFEQALYTI
jgi:hypothetical protein